MTKSKIIKILSLDYLIADMVIELDGNYALKKLIKKYSMEPGSKGRIDKAGFAAFSHAIEGYPVSISPGGSAANTLYTVGKILKNKVKITFIGAKGGSLYSKMIDRSLRDAGIKLIPKEFSAESRGLRPETTVSFVIKFPGGDRAIGTYPGNVAELIKPDVIKDSLIKSNDIIFFPGSLYRKFDKEVPDKILSLAKKYKKQVWATLPTQGRFSEEHFDMVRRSIEASASIVFGNEEELRKLYGAKDNAAALRSFKKAMQKNKNIKTAFITMGKNGVMIITREVIKKIPPIKVTKIVNTLGAGDTATAGFMVGLLCGLSYEESVRISLVLAKNKLGLDSARIPNPLTILKNEMPDVVKKIHVIANLR